MLTTGKNEKNRFLTGISRVEAAADLSIPINDLKITIFVNKLCENLGQFRENVLFFY